MKPYGVLLKGHCPAKDGNISGCMMSKIMEYRNDTHSREQFYFGFKVLVKSI